MNASEFDKMFDDGEDISHLVDWKSARRPALEARRDPQSLIKLWLACRLELAAK